MIKEDLIKFGVQDIAHLIPTVSLRYGLDQKTNVIMCSNDRSAKHVLKAVSDAFQELPDWIRPGGRRDNVREMAFDSGHVILARVANAEWQCLRGMAIDTLFVDDRVDIDALLEYFPWEKVRTKLYLIDSCDLL